jgi:hypothetical protein
MPGRLPEIIVELDKIKDRLTAVQESVSAIRKDQTLGSRADQQNLRMVEAKIEAARLSVSEAIYSLGLVL